MVRKELEYQTVFLPHSVGGLRGGLLDGKAKPSDVGGNLDVADEWLAPDGRQRRKRLWREGQNPEEWECYLNDQGVSKWREVGKFELTPTEEELTDEEQSSVKVWHWFVRPWSERG